MAFIALTFSANPAEARLNNVVTDWINATQARVAVLGVHNVPASRWYAQTALAIHNAVAAGGAPPQALAGVLGSFAAAKLGSLRIGRCWAQIPFNFALCMILLLTGTIQLCTVHDSSAYKAAPAVLAPFQVPS